MWHRCPPSRVIGLYRSKAVTSTWISNALLVIDPSAISYGTPFGSCWAPLMITKLQKIYGVH